MPQPGRGQLSVRDSGGRRKAAPAGHAAARGHRRAAKTLTTRLGEVRAVRTRFRRRDRGGFCKPGRMIGVEGEICMSEATRVVSDNGSGGGTRTPDTRIMIPLL